MYTVHGKQRKFTTELVAILEREALLQHANLSKTNNDWIREKVNLAKKLKSADEKLEDIRVNNDKTEQLKKDYNLKAYKDHTISFKKQFQIIQGENTYKRKYTTKGITFHKTTKYPDKRNER